MNLKNGRALSFDGIYSTSAGFSFFWFGALKLKGWSELKEWINEESNRRKWKKRNLTRHRIRKKTIYIFEYFLWEYLHVSTPKPKIHGLAALCLKDEKRAGSNAKEVLYFVGLHHSEQSLTSILQFSIFGNQNQQSVVTRICVCIRDFHIPPLSWYRRHTIASSLSFSFTNISIKKDLSENGIYICT